MHYCDSLYQTTLQKSVSVSGIGLHSGTEVVLTLRPAEAGSGITFKRTDIAGACALVAARYDNVTDTMLGTTISNAWGVSVSTIEHLMAAFWGMGVDNALVEVNASELPIMDGSSEPFVALIEKAGVKQLSSPRRVLEVRESVTISLGDSVVTLQPADTFSVAIEIDYNEAVIDRQSARYDFSVLSFRKALGRARTFAFEKDVVKLRSMGLARGGSLDNAVLVGADRILNSEGLRFADEFVRHKALDLVGDLSLAGYRIRGHVTATRPGHTINNRLLHELFADSDNYRIVSAVPADRVRAPQRVAVASAEAFA